jgi:uncharacterized protein (TIGR04222 family)
MLTLGAIFPFSLRGPAFLGFFAVLSVAMIVLASLLVRRGGGIRLPKIGTDDPYLIAYLRGGSLEAVKVATFALIDRGLLHRDDDKVVVKSGASEARVRRLLEKRILRHFPRLAPIESVTKSDLPKVAETEYQPKLEALGLLPDAAMKRRWRMIFALCALVVVSVAGTKLAIALAAGRSNVWFLIIGTVIVVAILFGVTRAAADRARAPGHDRFRDPVLRPAAPDRQRQARRRVKRGSRRGSRVRAFDPALRCLPVRARAATTTVELE